MTDSRRNLPSVDRLLHHERIAALLVAHPRGVVLHAIRRTLEGIRSGHAAVPDDWGAAVETTLINRQTPSLRPIINATGVVLHTNLGRAPLADEAIAAACGAAGYATLEFDLSTGARGSRQEHCAGALAELAGAEAAMVVNNAAGALVLALNAVAAGREVIISRGELIEIGGSFRIPDILARSGAILREVGTTNRTHLADYADAIHQDTGAILTVHRSNFEQVGFVASPDPRLLSELARAHGLPYLHDVGSGLMIDLEPWGLTGEPLVPDAVGAGADLVIFSGDKLLGGPQAGCLAGHPEWIARCRGNPLARALRADKMTLAALEATLALYRDPVAARERVPVLRMLTLRPEVLAARADRLRSLLASLPWPADAPACRVEESTPGGGSFPGAALATTVVVLDPGPLTADGLARSLRSAGVPVVGRVQADRVLLDPRTFRDEDLEVIVASCGEALAAAAR